MANISPSSSPTLLVPLVFASAGDGTWLAFLFATVAMSFVALNVNQFARRSASPGALYTFAAQGLGPTWGVLAGWSLVIAYLFTAAAVLAGSAQYARVLLRQAGLPGSETLLALVLVGAGAAVVWLIAYRDIKLSTRTLLVLEFATVAVILALAGWALAAAPARWDATQLSLHGVTPDGLRLGLVLAIFAFVGFESATALGHEARDPHRAIPRSVLFSVWAVGAFFIFVSYVEVLALRGHTPPFNELEAPLAVIATAAGAPLLGTLISATVVIGLLACTLASLQAGARVIYALARHGLVHEAAGRAHTTNATPHIALAATTLFVFAITAGMVLDGVTLVNVFACLGTIATFGFLFAYALVSLAAPAFLHRRGEPTSRAILTGIVATVLLLIPIVGSVYPIPAPPLNLLPYIFLALLAGGWAWFAFLRIKHPAMIARIQADLAASS